MLLSSTDTPRYQRATEAHPDLFGWFITPRKRGIPRGLKAGQRWACDNDCFNLGDRFNLAAFLVWLETLRPYAARCLFVPPPDVVANHKATLERFYETYQGVASLGFPVAFILQDGCAAKDVPWKLIDAVFLGGSDDYKLSQAALKVLTVAGRRGKWRHVGRVNSKIRINHFYGCADSFDGKTFACEPDKALRWVKAHLLWRKYQPGLFERGGTK